MDTKISSEVFDEYLKITIAGDNLFNDVKDILIIIKNLADENKRKKILIDALHTPNISGMQRFYMGEMGIDILGRNYKVAVIINREFIDKFMETVAVNRGGQLVVVGSEPEALDWLLG